MSQPAVLTATEASALLRVSERHIRNLVNRGQLAAASRDPLRISRACLERLLDGTNGQAPAPQHASAPLPMQRRVEYGVRPTEVADLLAKRDAEAAARKQISLLGKVKKRTA